MDPTTKATVRKTFAAIRQFKRKADGAFQSVVVAARVRQFLSSLRAEHVTNINKHAHWLQVHLLKEKARQR